MSFAPGVFFYNATGTNSPGGSGGFISLLRKGRGRAIRWGCWPGRAAARPVGWARSERKGLSLKVPEKGEGKLYLVLASEGVRADGQYRTGGEGLSLTRRYRDLEGTELDVKGGSVMLADLVYVEVQLKNTSSERIQNIALVDRLPAGWEIENARLGRGGKVEWASAEDQWSADYVNIRDDRVEVSGPWADFLL